MIRATQDLLSWESLL